MERLQLAPSPTRWDGAMSWIQKGATLFNLTSSSASRDTPETGWEQHDILDDNDKAYTDDDNHIYMQRWLMLG